MVATVNIRILEPGGDVLAKLEKLKNGEIVNFEDLLDRATTTLLHRTRKRFLEETNPDGKMWIPSRAGMIRRKNGGTGTLFDTGSLFHSISLLKKSKHRRELGVHPAATNKKTGVPVPKYALIHQIGKGGAIKRDFLGVSQDDAMAIEKVLAAFISGKIR